MRLPELTNFSSLPSPPLCLSRSSLSQTPTFFPQTPPQEAVEWVREMNSETVVYPHVFVKKVMYPTQSIFVHDKQDSETPYSRKLAAAYKF